MIPTMLVLGAVLGRWWRVVIPAGAAAWAVVLIATGVGAGVTFAIESALLAAANIAVGVLIFHGVRSGIRSIRHP